MSARAFIGAAALVGAALAPLAVAAQDAALLVPKPATAPDRNGVDVMSGGFSDSPVTLSVGQQGSGLVFRPTMTDRGRVTHNFLGSIVSVCAWDANLEKCEWDDGSGTYITVTAGEGGAVTFSPNSDGSYSPSDGVSASLTKSGTTWTFTAHDGSVATFAPPIVWEYVGDDGMSMRQTSLGAIQSLQRPSGERFTYHYRQNADGSYSLSSVTTNKGYQLFLEMGVHNAAPVITKAIVLNAAVESCAPTVATCTPFGSWPTAIFGYTSSSRTITDALSRTTYYQFGTPASNGGSRILGVRRPGRSSGFDMTLNYRRYVSDPRQGDFPYVERYGPVTSVVTDSGQWTYANTYGSDLREVTDPAGNKWSYLSVNHTGLGFVSLGSRLLEITDPLTNKTANQYAYPGGYGPVLSAVVQPEGNKTTYAYDVRGNVTEVRQVSKTPGTPADVVQSATYTASCSNPVTCNLPLTTTDARGGITDYTYDAAGNLLTVTGPAPTAGAARPRTVYTWEQRYAWYKQNGSSAITQASSPVWVMTSQYSCMTGATC